MLQHVPCIYVLCAIHPACMRSSQAFEVTSSKSQERVIMNATTPKNGHPLSWYCFRVASAGKDVSIQTTVCASADHRFMVSAAFGNSPSGHWYELRACLGTTCTNPKTSPFRILFRTEAVFTLPEVVCPFSPMGGLRTAPNQKHSRSSSSVATWYE